MLGFPPQATGLLPIVYSHASTSCTITVTFLNTWLSFYKLSFTLGSSKAVHRRGVKAPAQSSDWLIGYRSRFRKNGKNVLTETHNVVLVTADEAKKWV